MIDLLWSRADSARATLLLAHGAGAPMDSDFMNAMAEALAEQGVNVARFEFPYMQRRRAEQRKLPPDRAPKLLDCFQQAVTQLACEGLPLWGGGKSMGGRIASMLAANGEAPMAGVVAFGYPFHPPGKPEKTRTGHFADMSLPMLVCQGERDPFGKPPEVAGYGLPASVQVEWLPSADHDFKPLKRSGLTQAELIHQAARLAAQFIARHSG